MNIKIKIYIISVVFFAFALAFILMLVLPCLIEIKNSSEKLFSEKANVASFENQAIAIDNFKKNYALYQPNLEKMDTLFVDPQNPIDFIKFLEKTASESKVISKVSIMSLSGENQAAVSVNFQTTLNGDFNNVLTFLEKIESSPVVLEIDNLTITKIHLSKQIQATFSIKTLNLLSQNNES